MTKLSQKVATKVSLRRERLRAIREQRGMSQADLAEQCGIGRNLIYRYEAKGVQPSSDHLAKIARTLNVSADYLLGLTDKPKGQYGDTLSDLDRQLLEIFHNGDSMALMRFILAVRDRDEPGGNETAK